MTGIVLQPNLGVIHDLLDEGGRWLIVLEALRGENDLVDV